MNITFAELRRIKHSLPPGSIHRIAEELNIDEQTVRNYISAYEYSEGGIVHFEDTTILNRALEILEECKISMNPSEPQSKEEQIVHFEEPTISYSTLDEKEIVTDKKSSSSPKEMSVQLHIFAQMEDLRIKFRSKPVPPNVNISQLANEVNNL
ncbi:MAG: hypothetical protein KA165_19535 [Saprospiraceae bacterium]|nr:hypothetical protein [Saprospiraceae bacterium]